MQRMPAQDVMRRDVEEPCGLATQYLRFCAANLGQLEECITKHDVSSVSQIARTLRGNAGRIGLSELSSLGRQLEEYCLGPDWGAINSIYHAIAHTVSKLCRGESVRVPIEFKPDGHIQEVSVKRRAK